MKKQNLNVPNLGVKESLSREELKKVLGGTGSGTGGTCGVNIWCDGTRDVAFCSLANNDCHEVQ